MGYLARQNPRAMEGAGRAAGKTEDTVSEARLTRLLTLCSGPEELRAYVALNFRAHEQDAVYAYLTSIAPWAGPNAPKLPAPAVDPLPLIQERPMTGALDGIFSAPTRYPDDEN